MSLVNFFIRGRVLILACVICGYGCAATKQSMQAEPVVTRAPARVILSDLEQTYDGTPRPVNAATEPAGLTVSITYDGSTLAPVNAGSYRVVGAIQDANYEGSAVGRLTIAKAPQKISFNPLDARTFGDVDFPSGAIPGSGLPLAVKSSNAKIASIVNGRIHVVGAGAATITVSQAGNGNYLAAEPVQQVLTVKKAPARVILSGLEQTYDGTPRPINAATEPAGLTVSITYDKKAKAPVKAGNYQVVAVVQDVNYEGIAMETLIVAKAPQSITFSPLPARTFGDRPFDLSAAVSSRLAAVYTSSDPEVAMISNDRVTIRGAGFVEITASQPGDDNHLPAEPVKQTLTLNKAPAKVTPGKLEQAYDGSPKPAAATTTPGGLIASFTYEGSDTAPVNAGSYPVIVTIREANYEGKAEGRITITKAPQMITFNPLPARTYSEAPFFLEGTVSSGLTVAYESSNVAVATMSGKQVTIRGVGTTTITASQAGDDNHLAAASVQQTLTVKKALATVTLRGLDRTYDGKPKSAGADTEPAGLTTLLTYDSGARAPTNAGRYSVVATVQDANYGGSATGTMVIAKASQTISFNDLTPGTYGDDTPYLLIAAASSGLTATYSSADPAVATISGNKVKIKGAGAATITAYQSGDANFLAAEPVQKALIVKKAPAEVNLIGLDKTYAYDGTPKPVGATTSPAGLAVSITYDGITTAPVNAGSYRVVGAIQDANYEGSALGTMPIAKAPQMIKFPALAARTSGDGPFDLTAIVSSGLIPTYGSSDPAVAAVNGNQVTINEAGAATITAYRSGDLNYEAAEPVKRVLVVHGKKPHIVVLPLENLSGKPAAPLQEIRQSIIEALIKQGASVLGEGDLARFMVRHRVRYIGGVDTVTAQAWKDEAGMEAVLVTSVDQYDDTDTPKIALTSRLISTGGMPYILWMENADLSGDDSPGLFGSGLIDTIGALQHKAIVQIMDSLAGFYSERTSPGNGGAAKTFQPKVAYQSSFSMVPDGSYTVAVMPFYNGSKNSKAGDIIALRFVSQLVKNKVFQVLDPGVVRQNLLNFRIIMPYGISRADIDAIFNNLGTDLIFMGRVIDYHEDIEPKMEFDVQVYERKSRSIAWSSWSFNRGNEGVFFFDWRRVNNAGALASKMVGSLVRDLTMK